MVSIHPLVICVLFLWHPKGGPFRNLPQFFVMEHHSSWLRPMYAAIESHITNMHFPAALSTLFKSYSDSIGAAGIENESCVELWRGRIMLIYYALCGESDEVGNLCWVDYIVCVVEGFSLWIVFARKSVLIFEFIKHFLECSMLMCSFKILFWIFRNQDLNNIQSQYIKKFSFVLIYYGPVDICYFPRQDQVALTRLRMGHSHLTHSPAYKDLPVIHKLLRCNKITHHWRKYRLRNCFKHSIRH